MRRARVRVVVALVILAQEVGAVVVAVGCAHQCVDVVARPLRPFKCDRPLMVELDEDNRALPGT